MFCQKCGAECGDNAAVCLKCGCALRPFQQAATDPNGKGFLLTLLLCAFLGGFGVHRFYTGHTAIGIVQLLTFGGCGIWALIDLIMIATDSYKDSEGRPLVHNE